MCLSDCQSSVSTESTWPMLKYSSANHTSHSWNVDSSVSCPVQKKKHLIYDVYSNFHMQKKHQKYSNQAKVGNFPNISAPIPNISRYHSYTIASRQHLNNWGWRFRGQADSSNNLTQHRHHLVKLNNGKVVKQQIAGGKSTEMTSKKVQVIYFTVYRLNLEKNTALYKISPQSFCSV